MKYQDWIIISLIIACWGVEYLSLFAPKGVALEWILSDAELAYSWYIFLITNFVRFIIFAVCILIRPEKMHFITKEVLVINIIIMSFSLIWFIAFYHNPFSLSEAWIKLIITAVIYLSIFSIRWHAKHDNSIFGVGPVRRVD